MRMYTTRRQAIEGEIVFLAREWELDVDADAAADELIEQCDTERIEELVAEGYEYTQPAQGVLYVMRPGLEQAEVADILMRHRR